ncbi:MAG: alpha/beta fold hydrolase [Actinobacteria bacterium]|nr:alpha/beta fold hydrolase [Actinomycetota bacterium]
MASKRGITALVGAAVGVGASAVAQRVALNRRRKHDPEAEERFGTRRGVRAQRIRLDDGAQVFVEEVGPESPKGAIFVHGSALRTDTWHYQFEGLGDHRLVFCDLRGHGLSGPTGDKDYTMETLTGDLVAVMDEVGLEEAVVVGHSVGGMIALEIAKRYPERLGNQIRGLVLANTTYGPITETLIGGGTGLARIERVTRRPFDALKSQHARIEALRKLMKPSDAMFWIVALTSFGKDASAKQIDFVYDMISETPIEVVFDLVRSYRDFDMTDHLDMVTVPTLVLGGSEDRLTSVRASAYLGEHLPKAELHLFEGSGHMCMLERHEEFNRLVERFLDDVLGRNGGR